MYSIVLKRIERDLMNVLYISYIYMGSVIYIIIYIERENAEESDVEILGRGILLAR